MTSSVPTLRASRVRVRADLGVEHLTVDADKNGMVVPALLAAGFVFGLVLGKWWALVGAVVVGAAIGLNSEVDEVSPLFLGVGYGFVSAFAIALGVALRRAFSREVNA